MSSFIADRPKRIAFVATRIHGTDGVSLEIEKWTHVLERMGIGVSLSPGSLTGPRRFLQSFRKHTLHTRS